MNTVCRWFICLSVLLCSVAQAQNIEMLVKQQIEQDIARFALQQGWLDFQSSYKLRSPSALNSLGKCSVPVVIKSISVNIINRARYKVSCEQSQYKRKWSVNFSADISYEVAVVSLASNLPQGHRLTAADLVFTAQKIRRNTPFFFQYDGLIGKKIRRDLRAGSVIKERDIEVETLVTRGREVTISIAHDILNISTIGIALKSANLGEVIKVRNKSSGNIINALVVGENSVTISLN